MVNTDFTIQTTYLYTQPITVDKLAVEKVLNLVQELQAVISIRHILILNYFPDLNL